MKRAKVTRKSNKFSTVNPWLLLCWHLFCFKCEKWIHVQKFHQLSLDTCITHCVKRPIVPSIGEDSPYCNDSFTQKNSIQYCCSYSWRNELVVGKLDSFIFFLRVIETEIFMPFTASTQLVLYYSHGLEKAVEFSLQAKYFRFLNIQLTEYRHFIGTCARTWVCVFWHISLSIRKRGKKLRQPTKIPLLFHRSIDNNIFDLWLMKAIACGMNDVWNKGS